MIPTGIFPTRLKFAEIKPLHKKGEKSNISNYIPISLLTSFSKIFEKIMFTRLTHHPSDNHILANEQFGFRNELSTNSALFKLINDILTSLNNKLLVGGIFVIYKRLLIALTMTYYCLKCIGMVFQVKDLI